MDFEIGKDGLPFSLGSIYLLLFFVVSWANPIPWFLKIKNEFLSSSQHISDVTLLCLIGCLYNCFLKYFFILKYIKIIFLFFKIKFDISIFK